MELTEQVARVLAAQEAASGDAELLGTVKLRAQARTLRNHPLTPAERLAGFATLGFRPHGLYLPADPEGEAEIDARMRGIGALPDDDAWRRAYFALQDETETWAAEGRPGRWTGQQALARSSARFRIAGWGRRGGKTTYALHEALVQALLRPRSTVWLSGPIMRHVSRLWEPLVDIVKDLGLELIAGRNTPNDKYMQLANGSRIEGMSLENVWGAAGASVNFAVVDEAAQLLPEAWTRGVMPTLSDTMGTSLLLSSYEGREGFFFEQARKATEQGLEEWEAFHSESWRNYFVFRQGEDSPAIVHAKRNASDPFEFLEQYGAFPSNYHLRVYPEFKPIIHITDVPFDPALPVRLAVDPSKGANAYAVAVLQETPDGPRQIDEYYRVGAMAEDVTRALDARAWRANLVEGVMDNADPNEILRWNQAGYPMFAVPDKPLPPDRYPILRRLLRDPIRYWPIHEARLRDVLAAHGLTPDAYRRLPPEDRAPLEIDVEIGLADTNLSPATVAALQSCAHYRVDRHCVATIHEFENYQRLRPRKGDVSPQERGRKYQDHLMDALGYYAWVYHREAYLAAMESMPVLDLVIDSPYLAPADPSPAPAPAAAPEGPATRGRRFAETVRAAYGRGAVGTHSVGIYTR